MRREDKPDKSYHFRIPKYSLSTPVPIISILKEKEYHVIFKNNPSVTHRVFIQLFNKEYTGIVKFSQGLENKDYKTSFGTNIKGNNLENIKKSIKDYLSQFGEFEIKTI